ncbi:MAG: UDP-N-acetylglucosamine 2-epimerase [Candidatus Helarchaeota archaeon]|nr:UDP-N-acetylglucosamine 2-epimerase [Candidatus Helarchaeota archaeon]
MADSPTPDDIIPSTINYLPAKVNTKELRSILTKAEEEKKWVIQLVVGTKPDFYKQFSLMYWAKKLDIPLILLTTGQHYNYPLNCGLKEFSMSPTVDFQIRGNLIQKATELFYKMGHLAKWYKHIAPKTTILPIPHGDTISAAITATAWFLSVRQGVGQNEAGLRSMSPNNIYDLKPPFTQDFCENFIHRQWEDQWFVIRDEPYPEQWDTFVCGAGSSYFFAPHNINVTHLKREGYSSDRIVQVGNSVVDAIQLHKKPDKSIFDLYPRLDDFDNWIRVDIHRRGNLGRQRFTTLFNTISKLLKEGIPILWIEMNAAREALQYYGLEEKISGWTEKYKHFLFTPLWKNYGNVIEFWKSRKCLMEFTDSGSIQEELNELPDTLCCTMRFSTDRPESIFDAHSNILIPPYSEDFMTNILKFIINSDSIQKSMKSAKKIYGTDVGKHIIQYLKKEMTSEATPFRWTHQTLFKLPKEDDFEYL